MSCSLADFRIKGSSVKEGFEVFFFLLILFEVQKFLRSQICYTGLRPHTVTGQICIQAHTAPSVYLHSQRRVYFFLKIL